MARVLDRSYDELIVEAQEIFWLKGYKGVSVKDLSQHLNVGETILYNKYSKDALFLDSLDYYTNTYTGPFLKMLRETSDGIESLRPFFYDLVDALINKTFPRSCLVVNTVVELRNENKEVIKRYKAYLKEFKESIIIVLKKAYDLGQIKQKDKIEIYAEFLMGIVFSMGIFYKLKPADELRQYIDEQLSFIV
ncbi:MAG: TetR/AcrR family transcriptional regulator [Cyclobacteriaceae bacterium]